MYKSTFKENIDKTDGEIWKRTQNENLEELQSNLNDEYHNDQLATDHKKANEGSSRHQELNPSPIPGDQRDCVTPEQDTSMDD
jgi:hypothetical protein